LDSVVCFITETVWVSYNQDFAHIFQHRSIELLVKEFPKREIALTRFIVRIDELFRPDALLDFDWC